MKNKYVTFGLLAAALYALSAPFSKLLLDYFSPTMMSSLLYLGAGLGMIIVTLFQKKRIDDKPFSKNDIPLLALMVTLDIVASILLMLGLKSAQAENVSLLSNFEIVATSLIAFLAFREKISNKLWLAVILITLSAVVLSIQDPTAFEFSAGSLCVVGAASCWGLENNIMRKLSSSDPYRIVITKSLGSGIGSLLISFVLHEMSFSWGYASLALLLGFVSFGLSVLFYVKAQKGLGAARTGALFAAAPFIGVIVSILVFWDLPSYMFFIALPIMVGGVLLAIKDSLKASN